MQIGVGTKETRVLGEAPAAASQLDVDPGRRRVFVAGKSELVQFDPGSEKGDPKTSKLGSGRVALSFDPAGPRTGRLVVVTADRNLRKLDPDRWRPIGPRSGCRRPSSKGPGRSGDRGHQGPPVSCAAAPPGRSVASRLAPDRKAGRGNGALKGNGGLVLS